MTKRIFTRQIAFTLIELLLIIAIVVMLFALVFSGVRRAKEEALRKQCVQNLRQVGLAFRQLGDYRTTTQMPNDRGVAQQCVTNGLMFRVFEGMSIELNAVELEHLE